MNKENLEQFIHLIELKCAKNLIILKCIKFIVYRLIPYHTKKALFCLFKIVSNYLNLRFIEPYPNNNNNNRSLYCRRNKTKKFLTIMT